MLVPYGREKLILVRSSSVFGPKGTKFCVVLGKLITIFWYLVTMGNRPLVTFGDLQNQPKHPIFGKPSNNCWNDLKFWIWYPWTMVTSFYFHEICVFTKKSAQVATALKWQPWEKVGFVTFSWAGWEKCTGTIWGRWDHFENFGQKSVWVNFA